MLLRGLFFALLLYLLYRFLTRKLGGTNSTRGEQQHTRFDPKAGTSGNGQRKKNLDQIEEAEYEDITEKEKK